MTTPNGTTWELAPHTRAKHEILRRYLGAWFPILGSGYGRIIYFDGFCGPGVYDGGEPGSPLIALNAAIQHAHRLKNRDVVFWFLDIEPERIEHLASQIDLVDRPSNFHVHVQQGEFEQEFRHVLDDLASRNAQLAPTFAFLDPFGFKGVPFDLVSRLLAYRSCEALIYFPVDSINRWLEHPGTKVKQHICALLGVDDLRGVKNISGNRVEHLRLLYQQQLSTVARFVRYFEMRNNVDRTLYYLFFASNHALGHRKMKEAFWAVDAAGGYRFSDATNPDQLLLFDEDPAPKLAQDLQSQFAGRKIRVAEIIPWIDDETAYTERHMKAALRLLETNQCVTVDALKADGKKRKAGTFPADVIVQFRG